MVPNCCHENIKFYQYRQGTLYFVKLLRVPIFLGKNIRIRGLPSYTNLFEELFVCKIVSAFQKIVWLKLFLMYS